MLEAADGWIELRDAATKGLVSLRKFDKPMALVQSRPMPKPVLGRGLGALLGGSGNKATVPAAAPGASSSHSAASSTGSAVERVAITRIQPCSFQPRKIFS